MRRILIKKNDLLIMEKDIGVMSKGSNYSEEIHRKAGRSIN